MKVWLKEEELWPMLTLRDSAKYAGRATIAEMSAEDYQKHCKVTDEFFASQAALAELFATGVRGK